jgi:YbbR domain-containing protein
MKEKIFKNFSLKILSALCAIVLWTIIVNVYDPTTDVTYSNISVQFINTESLTDMGYSYEVLDGSKISVYVSGPKSVITDIKTSDIVATADLSQVTVFADYVDIAVEVVKDGQTLTNVEVTPMTTAVKLNIENRVTEQFDVSIDTNGSLAEGHVIVRQSVSPSVVKVTGSSSVVSKISQIRAICDVSGSQEDIQMSVPLVAYDSDGNVIDDIELSRNEVEYTASVYASKTIPVRYSVSGSPSSGSVVRTVELSEDSIVIAGDSSVLSGISSVVIPPERLNIEGSTSDKNFRIWISEYLPDDVTVVSDSMVTVTVRIADANSKDVSVSASNITFSGLQSGLTAYIKDTSSISVTISGASDVLSKVSSSDITGTINMTGLGEGEYTLSVQFKLPDGCSLTGEYKADVVAQKENQTSDIRAGSDAETAAQGTGGN